MAHFERLEHANIGLALLAHHQTRPTHASKLVVLTLHQYLADPDQALQRKVSHLPAPVLDVRLVEDELKFGHVEESVASRPRERKLLLQRLIRVLVEAEKRESSDAGQIGRYANVNENVL